MVDDVDLRARVVASILRCVGEPDPDGARVLLRGDAGADGEHDEERSDECDDATASHVSAHHATDRSCHATECVIVPWYSPTIAVAGTWTETVGRHVAVTVPDAAVAENAGRAVESETAATLVA